MVEYVVRGLCTSDFRNILEEAVVSKKRGPEETLSTPLTSHFLSG